MDLFDRCSHGEIGFRLYSEGSNERKEQRWVAQCEQCNIILYEVDDAQDAGVPNDSVRGTAERKPTKAEKVNPQQCNRSMRLKVDGTQHKTTKCQTQQAVDEMSGSVGYGIKRPHQNQTRQSYTRKAVEETSESIRTNGVEVAALKCNETKHPQQCNRSKRLKTKDTQRKTTKCMKLDNSSNGEMPNDSVRCTAERKPTKAEKVNPQQCNRSMRLKVDGTQHKTTKCMKVDTQTQQAVEEISGSVGDGLKRPHQNQTRQSYTRKAVEETSGSIRTNTVEVGALKCNQTKRLKDNVAEHKLPKRMKLDSDTKQVDEEMNGSVEDGNIGPLQNQTSQSDTIEAVEETSGNIGDDNKILDQNQRKQSLKRIKQCCAESCNSNNETHTLFSFPKPTDILRIQEWVKYGDENLAETPIAKLHKRFFLCSDHFEADQFLNHKGKRKLLKKDAIPTIRSITETTPKIADEVIPQNNLEEREDDGNCMRSFMANERIRKRCCAPNCHNNNTTSQMFSLPIVVHKKYGQKYVDETNLDTYRDWILSIGNHKLLEMDPSSVQKKYSLCADHFDDSCFDNSHLRSRLQKHAKPTRFLSVPFSPEKILLYDANILKWKLKNNFEEMDFSTLQTCATIFENEMDALKYFKCDNCKEAHLTSRDNAKCLHDKKCWEYSRINGMDPGEVPDELKDLTFIEEQLISRVHPMISVFKLNGLQYGYRGNIINFSQDVSNFASQLPHKIEDLQSVITVTYKDSNNADHDFRVRVRKVREALLWLKRNNPYYKNVKISEENLKQLPKDGNVLDSLPNVSMDKATEEEMETQEGNSEDDGYFHESGVGMSSFPHQDQQINQKLAWPELGSKVDEFNTPGYIVCAFPTLFPHGLGDLNDDRVKKVQKAAYFKHLLRYFDKRFATHPTFRFFAYNSCMRWNALTDGSIFVRNNTEFKNMTIPKLAELIKEKPSILKKIMFQASNLKGTRAYWHSRGNELRDMVDQIGLPTFFLTLSSADGHWDGLYKLLSGENDTSNLTESQRRKLIQDNPHIVDEYFDYRVKAFITNVLSKKYNVKDYWYRIEYQHRGSPHLHGIFWVEGAPDVTNIENRSEEDLLNILDYFSKLITAVNPDCDAAMSDIHPCRKSYSNILNFEEDLAQLLNKVQRHTRCSTDYCLKFNKEKGGLKCRFNFPAEMQDKATFEKDEKGQMQFKPARNDPLLNKYNEFIIQLWRGNCDISPVISKQALLAYLAKYISKCEISSKSLDEIVNNVFQTLDENDKARRGVQKLFMRFCGERDISAQEVCHSLMGLSLYSSGRRKFVTVNFKSEEWKQVPNDDDNEEHSKYGQSFVEKYKDRPHKMENISLWEAATLYNAPRWSKAKTPNIARIFPRPRLNPDNDSNEQYYKIQVLTHVPWRNEEELRKDCTWEQLFTQHNIQGTLDNLNKSLGNETIPSDDNEIDLEDEDNQNDNYEEWMILSRLGPNVALPTIELGNRQEDLNYKWSDANEKYTQYGTLQDFDNFIDNMKKLEASSDDDTVLPDIQLHQEQTDVLNLVQNQINDIKNNTSLSPKKIIVQGKAGTGKSLLIKHIVQSIKTEFGDDSYKLAAPTGVAAILINGRTLNSVFKLPKSKSTFKPLTGQYARKLCNDFRNIKFIIIDEFSMVGSTTLGMIDARCKEATGKHNEDFGGLNIIMFGDIQQLPPVKDYALYSNNHYSNLSKHGKYLFNSLQKAFVLQVCHRQQDEEFLKVLTNISSGAFTREDYDLLSTRFTNNLSQNEIDKFKSAIRLFSTKEEVAAYNLEKLSQQKDENGAATPVLKITAKHNSSEARKGTSDDAEGLQSKLFISKGCQIMLRKNLWVSQGLVNGAVGHVKDVIFEPNADPTRDMPRILLCEFQTYTGPGLIPGTKLVPIRPLLRTWTVNNQTCSRYQFPLTLAYACSVHKSQGMTLNQAVVNIGPREFALGLSYVALSRVRSLNNMIISPFPFSRISNLKDLAAMQLKIDIISWLSSKDA